MDEAGDFAGISFPFAAGILAGYMLKKGQASLYVMCGAVEIAAALALAALCALARAQKAPLRGAARPATILLFFLLGLFCQLSGGLWPVPASLPGFAARSAAALKSTIAAIPYSSPRTNALITALITGDRALISQDIYQCFRASGASHLLALSGLHLGVICLIVSRAASVFGNTPASRILRACLIISFSAFYALMTGAGPSIVRAFIFICLGEICSLSPERKRIPIRILLAALTIQLVFAPYIIESLGFQLSYLAMSGIILIYPKLSGWYPESGGPGLLRKIWKLAALSVSCQAFTFPLVWLRFHSFPKYFLITNLLAMPLTTSLIGVSVVTISLSAAGCCPGALIFVNEIITNLLLFVLETISGM